MRDDLLNKYTVPAAFFIALILIPFFEPNILSVNRVIDLAYTGMMAAVAFTAFVVYMGRMRVSPVFLVLILYRIWTLIAGILSTGGVDKAFISRSVFILGIFAIIELCLEMDEHSTLTAVFLVVFIYMFMNSISVLVLNPAMIGGKLRFFGGLRTRFPDFCTMGIFLSLLLSYRRTKRLLSGVSIITFLLAAAQMSFVHGLTGLLIEAAIFILALFYDITHLRIPSFLMVFGPLAMNFMLVFTKLRDLISNVAEYYFHKKAGLNGRYEIWEKFIRESATDFYLGAGETGNGGAVTVDWTTDLVPGHNTLIQLLFDSGIPGLILLCILVILLYISIRRCRDKAMAYIASIGMLAVGMLMVTEVVQYFHFVWLLPVMVANVSRLGVGKKPKTAVFIMQSGGAWK